MYIYIYKHITCTHMFLFVQPFNCSSQKLSPSSLSQGDPTDCRREALVDAWHCGVDTYMVSEEAEQRWRKQATSDDSAAPAAPVTSFRPGFPRFDPQQELKHAEAIIERTSADRRSWHWCSFTFLQSTTWSEEGCMMLHVACWCPCLFLFLVNQC